MLPSREAHIQAGSGEFAVIFTVRIPSCRREAGASTEFFLHNWVSQKGSTTALISYIRVLCVRRLELRVGRETPVLTECYDEMLCWSGRGVGDFFEPVLHTSGSELILSIYGKLWQGRTTRVKSQIKEVFFLSVPTPDK